MPRPIIALTAGDVAGIGPEILLHAVNSPTVRSACLPLVICHPEILLRAATVFTPDRIPEIDLLDALPASAEELRQRFEGFESSETPRLVCLNPAGDAAATVQARVISAAAGDAAFQYLSAAITLAQSGVVDAIATAPLNKAALHAAGHHFPGHTEILAEQCGVAEFGMMLYLPESKLAPLRQLIAPETFAAQTPDETPSCEQQPGTHAHSSPDREANNASESALEPTTPLASPRDRPTGLLATNGSNAGDSASHTSLAHHANRPTGLPVIHVTLHTSVKSVPGLLTTEGIVEKIRLMDEFLGRMGCERKAIGVCALNPHGGEDGLFGDEEAKIIEPAVRQFRYRNIRVAGPLPVDTLMRRAFLGEFDGVVAMYHDQGHIPVKLIGFDSAVNITLGLPIVRTSPTHGTAFDRAWNPATPADASGMVEAILTAAMLSE